MPKKRHKPEKIVARLRQGEAFAFTGQSVANAVRKTRLARKRPGPGSAAAFAASSLLLSAHLAKSRNPLPLSERPASPWHESAALHHSMRMSENRRANVRLRSDEPSCHAR